MPCLPSLGLVGLGKKLNCALGKQDDPSLIHLLLAGTNCRAGGADCQARKCGAAWQHIAENGGPDHQKKPSWNVEVIVDFCGYV